MEKHDFGDHNDSKESFFCRFNRLNHDCTPRVRDPVVFRQKYFVSQIIDRSQNNIEDTRHKLSCWPHPARNCQTDRAKWLSWLCYHQVKVEDSDCDDNAFVAPLRSLRFNRILLNVKNAPITFQHRKLEKIMSFVQALIGSERDQPSFDKLGEWHQTIHLQADGADQHSVRYAGRLLTSAPCLEKKAFFVVLTEFRNYVDGHWLLNLKFPTGRLGWLMVTIQSFDINVECLPGRGTVVAWASCLCKNTASCDLGEMSINFDSIKFSRNK